jgi:cytochrome b
MNIRPTQPAFHDTLAQADSTILVWDAPVRVFHWLLALCFAGAWLTGEREGWRALHLAFGATMAALVGFRLLWGLTGTRHARFASFVRGPRAALRYLSGLAHGRPAHHVGHNPAGALAILVLLALALLTAASGLASWSLPANHPLEELHEGVATAMLALVGLHLAAVLVSSLLHRENLVAAMIGGRKRGHAQDAAAGARRGVALLLVVGALAVFTVAWRVAAEFDPPAAAQAENQDRHQDED